MGQHYLVLTFAVGQDGVRREYFPVTHESELDDAIEAWVQDRLGPRQRSRDKAATKLKVSITGARIAHPTSCYAADIAAREARGIDHDAIAEAIAAGRKRKIRYS